MAKDWIRYPSNWPEARRRNYLARKKLVRAIVEEAKDARGRACLDCGKPEGMLHFHHRPGEEKLFSVGAAASWAGRRLTYIHKEIAKCDLLCPKCHRDRHPELSGREQSERVRAGWTPEKREAARERALKQQANRRARDGKFIKTK